MVLEGVCRRWPSFPEASQWRSTIVTSTEMLVELAGENCLNCDINRIASWHGRLIMLVKYCYCLLYHTYASLSKIQQEFVSKPHAVLGQGVLINSNHSIKSKWGHPALFSCPLCLHQISFLFLRLNFPSSFLSVMFGHSSNAICSGVRECRSCRGTEWWMPEIMLRC